MSKVPQIVRLSKDLLNIRKHVCRGQRHKASAQSGRDLATSDNFQAAAMEVIVLARARLDQIEADVIALCRTQLAATRAGASGPLAQTVQRTGTTTSVASPKESYWGNGDKASRVGTEVSGSAHSTGDGRSDRPSSNAAQRRLAATTFARGH